MIALVAWWSVPQPKPNLWAISESIVNDAAKAVTTLNFSDILPWVPVVVLILVIIASIKTRSGYQWLLERYKQSYEIFYGLAYKARAVREPLNSVVEGASHIYTYCIIPLMVKEITNKRGRWIPGEGLSFPFPPVEWDPIYHRDYGNSTEPPWNLEQWKSEYRRHVEFTLELLEATQVMVDYYKEEVTGKNYQVFVDQIAPVPSFQLLDYLGFDDSKSPSGASVVPRLEWNRERIPFLGANLEKLTLNGLEEHILSKLNGLSSPTAKFVDLPQDEEPTQEMQDAVSKEVDNLMDMYRRTIVSACWFDEELRAIIRSAEKFARPSKWRTKLQAVISK